LDKIVVKFGGSNFKNKDDITKLIKIIEAYDQPIIIVVSAFYGITDFLISAIDQVSKRVLDADAVLERLNKTSIDVINTLTEDNNIREELYLRVNERIKELKKYLLGIHYLEEIPDFVYDSILSYGERISSMVFSLILKKSGFPAEEKLPEQTGL